MHSPSRKSRTFLFLLWRLWRRLWEVVALYAVLVSFILVHAQFSLLVGGGFVRIEFMAEWGR